MILKFKNVTDDFNDINKYKELDRIIMARVDFKETKHIAVLKGV